MPHCVRVGIDCASRLSRARIVMDTHTAEVVAEALLHEIARRRVERLAGRLQDFIDNRWRAENFVVIRGFSLQRFVFFLFRLFCFSFLALRLGRLLALHCTSLA